MNKKNESEKIPVVGRIEPQINRYYLKISRRYMTAGIILMLILVLYIIFIMMFFGRYVTYDNLKYLIKDIGNVSLPGSENYTSIVYNGSDNLKAQSFRGGLAMCSKDSYMYYDSGGILLTEQNIGYASPEMAASDKYMLVYDVGGTGYSVYNQLTCIIDRQSEQRIVSGDISDNGSMILVTRSRETKYVVELYNSAFVKSMSIYKENYVLGAAISPDGNYIVIASGIPDGTDLDCEISICKKGESSPLFTSSYSHTMPLDIHAEENGFILLCDNGLYFFDYSGAIGSSLTFSGMNLRCADINSESAAVTGSVNALGSENRCAVFGSSGEVLYDSVLEERIVGTYASANLSDALVYLKTTDKVIKILPDGTKEEYIPENDVVTVVPLEKGALLCSKSSAVPAFTD